MKNLGRVLRMSAAILLISCIFARHSYAYLDPGTGSYIFQLALASLLGTAFAVKLFWKNIRTALSRLFTSEERQEDDEE